MSYVILTWLSCCLVLAEGFSSSLNKGFSTSLNNGFSSMAYSKTAFLGTSPSLGNKSCASEAGSMRMDLEEPFTFNTKTNQELLKRYNVPIVNFKKHLRIPKPHSTRHPYTHSDIDEALQKHGMPWNSSIDPTYASENGLFYMPFFEWQLSFMKENLTNLRLIPTQSKTGQDLTYVENDGKTVRMITLCFASDEYRKIRMTVYDAGNRTQVFTSLWYPQPEYKLPVLGIDLLQFNQDRHLCVIDFQPIQGSEQEHAQSYEHLLKPIRNQYPSLQGQMSKRFYDETKFFSNQMLFGRFEELQNAKNKIIAREEHPAYRDLYPAFQQYVQTHLRLVQSTPPQCEDSDQVLQGHADYDTYSADRDPAHAMFTKVFGAEFADSFVYDVLFSLSRTTQREE